ncbi:hypothetical protein EV363DRAFT_1403405 [Boletus edulis]|nr:hypothetical protein EV363DRAFT_1403405 [Boletus edulis]
MSKPASSQLAHPIRTNAGKGGYLSQLRKTSEALEQPQRESQVKDLLVHEPVNHLALALSRPKKKGTMKQRIRATTEEANSDPFEANVPPIAPSGPDGRFGLQPRPPAFIGRQTLHEYERDRMTNDMTAHTRKHGVHSPEILRNNSDEGTQTNIDEHRRRMSDFNCQELEAVNMESIMRIGWILQVIHEVLQCSHFIIVPSMCLCNSLDYHRIWPETLCSLVAPFRMLNTSIFMPFPHHRSLGPTQTATMLKSMLYAMANADYNVLAHHHLTNRCHRSPDPRHLDNVRDGNHQRDGASRQQQTQYEVPVARQEHVAPVLQEHGAGVPDEANVRDGNHPRQCLQTPIGGHDRVGAGNGSTAVTTDRQHDPDPSDQPKGHWGQYSKNQKSAIQAKPSQISFYPPHWQQLLEIAKAEMRRALFCGHPFLPERRLALKGECYEVLLGIIARYEEEEKGIMIKRAVQEAVPSGYALYAPPSVATQEARITFVKDRATSFLKDSEYLMGEPNEQGKRLNFGHLVLKQVCLLVYYPKTSKSLRNFPEFQDAVPRKALALVAAMVHFVLTLYKNHGKDINPNIISKDLERVYNKFIGSMQKLDGHHSKGQCFRGMLAQWADKGMDGFSNARGDDDDDGNEFGMNISDSEVESALLEQSGENDVEDQDFGAHGDDNRDGGRSDDNVGRSDDSGRSDDNIGRLDDSGRSDDNIGRSDDDNGHSDDMNDGGGW